MNKAEPNSEDIKAIIRARRTVHEFTDQPVPDHLMEQAFEILRWAPNHHRTEPWRIYRLGSTVQRQIAELNAQMVRDKRGEKAAEIKLKRWLQMPGWLLLNCVRSDDQLRQQEDYAACCCAAQNMMLALWQDGVGMKWTTGDVVRRPEFSSLVGFDQNLEKVVGLFWYGYPAQIIDQHRAAPETFVSHVD